MRAPVAVLLLLLLTLPVLAGEEPAPFEFEGLVAVDPDDLLTVAREDLKDLASLLARNAPVDDLMAFAEDAAFEMRLLLKRRGYPLATVEPSPGDGIILFSVSEGPRVLVREVTIEGVEAKDESILRKYVEHPRTWILGSDLYVKSAIAGIAGRMESYLRQRGYQEARVVVLPSPALEAERASPSGAEELLVTVPFTVTKGPVYLLSKVSVSGMKLFSEGDLLSLPGVRELRGSPYGPFTPFDLKAVLVDHYGKRGHPFMTVTEKAEFEPAGDHVAVHLSLEITEGPEASVGRILIRGNRRTQDEVLRRELEIYAKETYDIDRVARAQKNLIETGLFQQVFIEVVKPATIEGEKVVADLSVSVREREFKRLETSIGWGTWDLLRGGASLTWSNINGTSQSSSISAEGSLRGARLAAYYRWPWAFSDLLPDRTTFVTEGFIEDREQPTYRYKRRELGIALRKKEVFHHASLSLGYTFSFTDVFEVTGSLPDEFENTTDLGKVNLLLLHDDRNNPWSTNRGGVASLGYEYANQDVLGGELSFHRGRLLGTRFLELGEGLTLAGRIMVGAMFPFGETEDIPIQERFFLGGGQTVRSFKQDDLGPRLEDGDRVTSSAAGGEFFSLANLEFRAKLGIADLEAALFIDGGNVIQKISDASLTDYRFALGVGIRIATPIGPARLDFGVNPNPKEYEDRWNIFFAVGYPF